MYHNEPLLPLTVIGKLTDNNGLDCVPPTCHNLPYLTSYSYHRQPSLSTITIGMIGYGTYM